MKKHYPWLWFDADGTLFDYQRAEINALRQTFVSLALPFQDSYLEVYHQINDELWRALERGETTQAVLRLQRFERLLEAIQLSASTDEMSGVYLEQLSMGADLIDGAYEVLQTLSQTCRVAIVTNGIAAVQRGRFARSTIQPFIRELIISEEIGAAKPDPAFFEVASARTGNPPKSEVLLVGDSLTSDMRGGVNYEIDTCWFNPAGEPEPEGWGITYRIGQLRELLEIIE